MCIFQNVQTGHIVLQDSENINHKWPPGRTLDMPTVQALSALKYQESFIFCLLSLQNKTSYYMKINLIVPSNIIQHKNEQMQNLRRIILTHSLSHLLTIWCIIALHTYSVALRTPQLTFPWCSDPFYIYNI